MYKRNLGLRAKDLRKRNSCKNLFSIIKVAKEA